MKNIYIILLIVALLSGIYAQQWVEQIQPVPQRPLRSVSAVNGNFVWACGDLGTVLYTSNGGTVWIHRGGGQIGNNNVYAIYGIDSLRALCAVNSGTAGYIYRTTNAGFNWSIVFSKSGGFINDIKPAAIASQIIYAYGNPVLGRWFLLRSTNGGISFDTSGLGLNQSGNESGWPNAMAVMGTNIWFGTNNFRIYKSTDGGMTWIMSPIAGPNIYSISFNNTAGLAVGDMGYYTTNSGINWILQINLPGSGPFGAVSNLGQSFWFGRGSNIFFSTNNGVNFNFQYTSPSMGIFRHLSFVLSPNVNILTTVTGWGVLDNGAISHYSELIGIIKTSTEIPNGFNLHQNYPNPFNPVTNIRFDLPASSNVTIKVYSIGGEELEHLLSGTRLSAGSYLVSWDGSKYSSGVYFCKLETGDYTEVKKMTLIK